MSTTTQKNPALRNAGFILFFLSGICAISSGVVVSILRDSYDLSFSSTGTLLSIMSAGALLCPFLIQAFLGIDAHAPMIGIALAGLLMWFLFLVTKLPDEETVIGIILS